MALVDLGDGFAKCLQLRRGRPDLTESLPCGSDSARSLPRPCGSGDFDVIRFRALCCGAICLIGICVCFGFVDLDQTHLVFDLELDLLGQTRVVAQEVAHVLLALAQLVTVIGEP